jgi:hypothetical protein
MTPPVGNLSRRELLRRGLLAAAALPAAGAALAAAPIQAVTAGSGRAAMAGTAGGGPPVGAPVTPPSPGAANGAAAAEPAAGRYLAAAAGAARFIHSARVEMPPGVVWLAGPDCPDGLSAGPSLYSGGAGVVLFLLELANVTGEAAHRDEAVAAADYLAASLPLPAEVKEEGAGLYSGLAGIALALDRTAAATGEARFQTAAARCRTLLCDAAVPVGAGVTWGDTTDIIGGAAGIGLYLLDAADSGALGAPGGRTGEIDPLAERCRTTALRAGLRLIERGLPVAPVQPVPLVPQPPVPPATEGKRGATVPAAAGPAGTGGHPPAAAGPALKWPMDSKFPRLMPNFSHGTAGIAYFLATLYLSTRRPELLEAALAGARYLISVADTTGDGCLIFHDEPDNPHLYYLGWCHGPVGTARLFLQLARATGDEAWMEWVWRGARAIQASGIPERRTPGFWNNAGLCCGAAGVAEFFLQLHRLSGAAGHMAFARRVADDLLARASARGGGLAWVQAEHRIRPDYVYAQTGLMQGAAGIGMLLLHLDAVERGRPWRFSLPDSPFRA